MYIDQNCIANQNTFKIFHTWVRILSCVPKSCHNITFFCFFLPHHVLPCKDTFMDDYDRIYNCNGLKYNPCKNFDNFLFIIFMGIKI
jgi:hypothetical protein